MLSFVIIFTFLGFFGFFVTLNWVLVTKSLLNFIDRRDKRKRFSVVIFWGFLMLSNRGNIKNPKSKNFQV
jgi:hypothetical protein